MSVSERSNGAERRNPEKPVFCDCIAKSRPKLKKINVPERWRINTTQDIYVSFRKLPMLEKDSIIKMFNRLQPITPSGHIAAIILDEDKEALLSEEEKNIVTNKGFELYFY